MLGQEPSLGIQRVNLPDEVVKMIDNEEQLREALSIEPEDEDGSDDKLPGSMEYVEQDEPNTPKASTNQV